VYRNMDPTVAERQAFTNVVEIARWAGFDEDPADPDTALGAMFAMVGVTPTAHWRIVGFISEADFTNLISGGTWKIPVQGSAPRAPTPAEAAKAGIWGRACRICTGRQLTAEDEKKAQVEADERKIALVTAQQANSPTSTKKVKLNAVIDQLAEAEETPLDKRTVDSLYKTFIQNTWAKTSRLTSSQHSTRQ
jgi:hypothetical protein